MTEFDSVAAARELRDSVPADQTRLWRFMDIIVKNFERERDRRMGALARARADIGQDTEFEPQRPESG